MTMTRDERNARARARYAANRDERERRKARVKEYQRRRYASDPEYRERKKARVAIRDRRVHSGATPEQYDAAMLAQGGRCAICDRSPRGVRPLNADHDHENGEFRGLLCTGCNTALGKLGDSAAGLARALAYLEPIAGRGLELVAAAYWKGGE